MAANMWGLEMDFNQTIQEPKKKCENCGKPHSNWGDYCSPECLDEAHSLEFE